MKSYFVFIRVIQNRMLMCLAILMVLVVIIVVIYYASQKK